MKIINKWIQAIKNFFRNKYPEPIVNKPTKRKTNVKRTPRKKNK